MLKVEPPEAGGNKVQSVAVQVRDDAATIKLLTSLPVDTFRLLELPAENAYIVEIPGPWSTDSALPESRTFTHSVLRRVQVESTGKALRLVIYCAPEVINQPQIVSRDQGLTVTVR